MTVRLSVDKRKVYDIVSRQTEYDAVKTATEEESSTGTLPTQKHDEVILQDFWTQAASELTTRIGRHIDQVNEDAVFPPAPGLTAWVGYDARLRLPSCWPRPLLRALERSAENYMAQAILGRWYTTNGMTDKAQLAYTQAEGYGKNVANLICKRR